MTCFPGSRLRHRRRHLGFELTLSTRCTSTMANSCKGFRDTSSLTRQIFFSQPRFPYDIENVQGTFHVCFLASTSMGWPENIMRPTMITFINSESQMSFSIQSIICIIKDRLVGPVVFEFSWTSVISSHHPLMHSHTHTWSPPDLHLTGIIIQNKCLRHTMIF